MSVFDRQQPFAVHPHPGWRWRWRLWWGWVWNTPWPLLSLSRAGPTLESHKLHHQECFLWPSCPVEGLVPSLLPWETHPDAWEVREERNVWHTRSAVARRWSSPDTRRSSHPKGVWKLEKTTAVCSNLLPFKWKRVGETTTCTSLSNRQLAIWHIVQVRYDAHGFSERFEDRLFIYKLLTIHHPFRY